MQDAGLQAWGVASDGHACLLAGCMAFDTVQGVQLVLSKRQAMGLATCCYLGLDSGDIVSAQVLLICGSSLGLQAIRRPHTATGAVNPDKVVGMLTRFRGSLG